MPVPRSGPRGRRSSSSPDGTLVITSPVAGLTVSNRLPDCVSAQLAIDEHPGLRPQRAGVAAEVLDGQQFCLIDMHGVTRYRSSTTSVPRRGTEQQSSTSPAARGATGSST
jgi:hypothetical protein